MKPTTITAYPIMLPTNEETKLFIRVDKPNVLLYNVSVGQNKTSLTHQGYHLYLTSDEEIKEGDWFINNDGLWQCKNGVIPDHGKKVIAATDESLGITDYIVSPVSNFLDFPQIPKSFIKQWVESNGTIESVELEMEVNHNCTVNGGANPCLTDMTLCKINGCETWYTLKTTQDNCVIIHQEKEEINAKDIFVRIGWDWYDTDSSAISVAEWCAENMRFIDNTIIHQEEGKMYSREEVVAFAKKYAERCQAPIQAGEKWIKENL